MHSPLMRRHPLAALATGALLAVAAAPAGAAPVRDALPGASTAPAHRAATNATTALLTAVRASRHAGFDRVVLQFRGALPGYDVRYIARPVRQDGSGNVVRVRGAFVLQMRMDRALDADLSQPSAPPTYTGPRRIAPATREVVELVRTGGFEGVLTWVAGVRHRVPFRVRTLSAPRRVVIDVAHR